MKKLLLAVALAPFALGFSLANAQTSVTTDPVGFVKIDLQPGYQLVGAALLNPAVAAGRVASSDGTSITLEGEVGSLEAGVAHYVEVTAGGDGTFIGDRFEVTGASGNTIQINAGHARNTISLASANLAGYNVVVRPHVTLAQLFPTDQLQAGGGTTGDQVLFWDRSVGDGAYSIHTLTAGIPGVIPDSWQSGGQNTNNRVIAPGEGFFVQRRGGPISLLTNIGEVRTNDFRQPLGLGYNLIAEGHPVDNSPMSRLMTTEYGFQAGGGSTGDQILKFVDGGYQIYTYTAGIPGVIPDSWQSGGQNADHAEIFEADGAVFFLKRGSGEPDYTAPKTF